MHNDDQVVYIHAGNQQTISKPTSSALVKFKSRDWWLMNYFIFQFYQLLSVPSPQKPMQSGVCHIKEQWCEQTQPEGHTNGIIDWPRLTTLCDLTYNKFGTLDLCVDWNIISSFFFITLVMVTWKWWNPKISIADKFIYLDGISCCYISTCYILTLYMLNFS